jgi:hypothetical protein
VAERGPPSELPRLLRIRRDPAPWWRRALYVGGAALAFAAGIAGWVIPVLTGLPFWIAGFVLLAMASQRVRHAINAAERRLPLKWRRGLRDRLRRIRSPRLRATVNLSRGSAHR